MARLSTHVLDTARGVAARGIAIDVHIVRDGARERVATATTNADGRTEAPLLSGDHIEPGVYELSFHVGDYFKQSGLTVTEPPFLDLITLRVGLADASGHYHVPLLLSPYGYSTYRGT